MGVSRVLFIGLFVIFILTTISTNEVFALQIFLQNPEDYDNLPQWMKDLIELQLNLQNIETIVEKSSEDSEKFSKPTFGLDHKNSQKVVEGGFSINNQTFSINDNFHTPFSKQTVNIGEVNSFKSKIYADKGLKVQEFLFGIPKVGDAHLAEVGVEVWFGYDGIIQQVKAVQNSNVIDEETLVADHEKTKCKSSDVEEKCDAVTISMKFLEPLKDDVIAIKAIDFKNRYQITYLNEGIDVSGKSLNPMKTQMIPSGHKGEGLIKITQIQKYSPYWMSDDQRLFEKNDFGSFKEINYEFKRFHDGGDARTRSHSEFGGIINYEKIRAAKIFNARTLISETPESFSYEFPENTGRINEQLEEKMAEQEEFAKKILEDNNVQARWH